MNLICTEETAGIISRFFREDPLPVAVANDCFIKDPIEGYAFSYYQATENTISFLNSKIKELAGSPVASDLRAWVDTLKIMNASYRHDMKLINISELYDDELGA